MAEEMQRHTGFIDRVKTTLHLYFKDDVPFDIATLGVNIPDELDIML